MFEEKDFSNGNLNDVGHSQINESDSDAAYTEGNGQAAGEHGSAGEGYRTEATDQGTETAASPLQGSYSGGYQNSMHMGGNTQGNAGTAQGWQAAPGQGQAGRQYGMNGQNRPGYGQQGGYGGYGSYQSWRGNYQYNTGDYGTAPNQNRRQSGSGKEKKPKKPMAPFWKKALAVAAGGICFGVLAGVSFLAVSSLGNNRPGITVTQPEENVAVQPESQTAAPESDSGIKSTMTMGTTSAVVSDVSDVVEGTMPSIVSITNQSVVAADFWGQTFEQEQESAGSGIIIGENDAELLIVTNNHVVEGSTKLSVKFIDDEVLEAQIKGTSPSMDLAVIAVKLADIPGSTRDAISIAVMGDSDSLKVGEPVIAIGNALGYGQSVTTGVVSALNRTLEVSETGTSNALIQTDAAINPGNSGGALLDIRGQVIGINSNKIGGNAIEGMGYAIPISSARPIIEELMNRETRERVEEANRGYLGVSIINVTAAMAEAYGMPEGILIAQVYPSTGAEAAGLVKGDIIVGFAGSTVTTQDDLSNAMQYYAVGDTVEITIMRGNITDGYQEQKVSVTLTSQEAMNMTNK